MNTISVSFMLGHIYRYIKDISYTQNRQDCMSSALFSLAPSIEQLIHGCAQIAVKEATSFCLGKSLGAIP